MPCIAIDSDNIVPYPGREAGSPANSPYERNRTIQDIPDLEFDLVVREYPELVSSPDIVLVTEDLLIDAVIRKADPGRDRNGLGDV